MKMFRIRVNGNEYEVEVEEITPAPGDPPAKTTAADHTPAAAGDQTRRQADGKTGCTTGPCPEWRGNHRRPDAGDHRRYPDPTR